MMTAVQDLTIIPKSEFDRPGGLRCWPLTLKASPAATLRDRQ